MWVNYLTILGWIPLIATALFAFWKGGPAERIGGPLNLFTSACAYFINVGLTLEARPVPLLIADGLLAMGFLALALRYTSLWIGGAMLLQAAQFMLHAYYFVTHKNADTFHAWVNNTNTTGVQIFIIIGTIASWRQRVVRRRKDAALAATARTAPATN